MNPSIEEELKAQFIKSTKMFFDRRPGEIYVEDGATIKTLWEDMIPRERVRWFIFNRFPLKVVGGLYSTDFPLKW